MTIITDPVFSERASPLSFIGPRRVRQPAVRIEELPSHRPGAAQSRPLRPLRPCEPEGDPQRFDPQLVTPLDNGRLVSAAGIPKVEELDWWHQAGRRVAVDVTPAQHFSARTPFDRDRALWGGFVLGRRRGGSFSPATPATRRFGNPRAPRCDRSRAAPDRRLRAALVHETVHMNPEEAVRLTSTSARARAWACTSARFN